jgi:hypothetical protein
MMQIKRSLDLAQCFDVCIAQPLRHKIAFSKSNLKLKNFLSYVTYQLESGEQLVAERVLVDG